MSDEIKLIDPFTNIPYAELPIATNENAGATFLSNLRELNIGDGGSNVFRADKQGIWLGGATFATATFSVAMSGAILASSFTLTGGTIKYGKTSFTDTVNSGYFLSALGLYFGGAADATKFKFTVADGSLDYIGTFGGGVLSTAILTGAISSVGHFIDDRLNTSAKTILGDFTFGASGAIKMITDVNNGLWLSPTGILGKKAGVTTFAIGIDGSPVFAGELTAAYGTLGAITIGTNAWHVDSSGNIWWGNFASYAAATYKISAAGVANLSGLVVGTNVGLGTAEDSAGVTTIIGNTVTTGFVNALNVTAEYVVASVSLTTPTVTGGTIQTATTGQRIVLAGSTNDLKFYDIAGNLQATLYGVSAAAGRGAGLGIFGDIRAESYDIYVDYVFAEGGISVVGNIGVTGTVDGVDISAHAGNADAHHAQSHTHASHTGIGASDHHSSVSNGLTITPLAINMGGDIDLNSHDVIDVKYLKFNSTYGKVYWGTDLILDLYSTYTIWGAHFDPLGAGSYNLGGATRYWNDISYKTLTDRGCLGWFEEGVELQNGKKVSDLEAIKSIQKHPTEKTVYGVPRLDYKTMPKCVYKPAADHEGKLLKRDKDDKPYLIDKKTKEKIYGQDGAETTALISIMLGSIKELDAKIEKIKSEK